MLKIKLWYWVIDPTVTGGRWILITPFGSIKLWKLARVKNKIMFKETPEGQTQYCTHTRDGSICGKCLGKMNDEPIGEDRPIKEVIENRTDGKLIKRTYEDSEDTIWIPKESIREAWGRFCEGTGILTTKIDLPNTIADWFLSRTIPRDSLKEGIENIKNPYDIDSMSTFRKGFDKAKDLIISLISKQ